MITLRKVKTCIECLCQLSVVIITQYTFHVEDYLDVASIAGFSYVHSRHHWVTRLFWLVTIVIGLFTAGYMINSAFDDWSEHPVITTLDSIAASIEDIQFPTVTVCLDQPPDNWAFLEHVLNSLAFSCKQEGYLGTSKFENCNDTEALRQDFKFLVRTLVDVYQRIPYEFGESSIPKGLFSHEKNYEKQLKMLLKMIKNRTVNETISSFELRNMVVDAFSKNLSPLEVFDMLANDGNLYDFDGHFDDNCIFGEECRNTFLIKLMHEFTLTKQTFGSVVRNYMHLDSESFSSINTYKYIQDKFNMRKYDNICNVLNKNEKKMHEYLTNISKLVGFDDSELISSFDIPGIFGNSRNLDDDSWPPLMPQTFLYSKCKEYYEDKDSSSFFTPALSISKFEFSESCIRKWDASFSKSLGNCHCFDACGYRGENYTWCNTHTAWDYCDLEIQVNFTTYEELCKNTECLKSCCQHTWSKRIGNNLKALMKIMRFSSRRGKSSFTLNSILPNPDSTKALLYPIRKGYYSKEHIDIYTLLPWCNLINEKNKENQFDVASCQLFQPVFTDLGMCHSFNPSPALNMLKPSYFKDSFADAFREDLQQDKRKIINAFEAGEALDFYLLGRNHRQFMEKYLRPEEEYANNRKITNFFVALSNQFAYFGMKDIKKTIKAGYHVTWNVQAMENIPSIDLHDIPIDKRNCRMTDEIEGMEIFQIYSQSACEFEFKIKRAKDICNCVPWYIPVNSMSRYAICDIGGNFCFEKMMKIYSLNSTGHCLPNCHELRFTTDQYMEKLDVNLVCEDTFSIESFIAQETSGYGNGDNLIFIAAKLQDLLSAGNFAAANKSIDLDRMRFEYCRKLVREDLARLTILFENKKYVRSRTKKRVTFSERLGAFGGNLGLLTGMSILSIVEMIYWISIFLIRLLTNVSKAPNQKLSYA